MDRIASSILEPSSAPPPTGEEPAEFIPSAGSIPHKSLPPLKNKIRDNPQIDRLVAQWILEEWTDREIADELNDKYGFEVSYQTVFVYRKKIFAERISSADEKVRADFDRICALVANDNEIEMKLVEDEEEMIKRCLIHTKRVEERFFAASREIEGKNLADIDSSMLRALSLTMKEVRESYKDLTEIKKRILENKARYDGMKLKVFDEIMQLVMPKVQLEPDARQKFLQEIRITVKRIDI